MIRTALKSLMVVALAWSAAAGAVQLKQFVPDGAMARIMQVQADFDEPAVKLGDGAAPAPFVIHCDRDDVKGSGHWEDPQHWVYRFNEPLTGAVSCTATPDPQFRDLYGKPIERAGVHRFSTGGPVAHLSYPWQDRIAEDQAFVLRFNAPVDPTSLVAHSYCEVQGLGEAVATRLVQGEERAAILKAVDWDAREAGQPPRHPQILQCKRRLPADARVTLVVGPGVASVGTKGQGSVPSQQVLKRDFRVRKAFQASLSCTRLNAQAPCSPLSDLEVRFSSPTPYDQAKRIQLLGSHGPLQAKELGSAYQRDSDDGHGNPLQQLTFKAPFAARAELVLDVPGDLTDDSGRRLDNAARFPLRFTLDAMPPLVKFASGRFGIIERFADKPAGVSQTPTVPLAVRHVGPQLQAGDLTLSAGTVDDHVVTRGEDAIAWLTRVRRMQDGLLTKRQFANVMADRAKGWRSSGETADIDVRSRSMFTAQDAVRTLKLPGLPPADQSAAEVIGVPVEKPGLHVIQVASPQLGQALLAGPHPMMYVRSAILVTNLAVHVKLGRDDALVWVTALDSGAPVSDARIDVLDSCGGHVAQGVTDRHGIWHDMNRDVPAAADAYCQDTDHGGVFVTASVDADNPAAHGEPDFSFAWSTWDEGIEPWRFDVPYSLSTTPDYVAHAVMDRTLIHRGETVSMRILARRLTRQGISNPGIEGGPAAGGLPNKVRVSHTGTGDHVDIPVTWKRSPTGGVYALAKYSLPKNAHLGRYDVEIERDPGGDTYAPALAAGSFQVASFKLPVLTGSMKIVPADAKDQTASGALIAPHAITADVQLKWQSGGAAGGLPATVSAVAAPFTPNFADYGNFSFGVPDDLQGADETADGGGREVSKEQLRHVILDKHPVTLDDRGGARVALDALPVVHLPQTWHFETSFVDPNGEVQTISQSRQVWPSRVVVGMQTSGWLARGEKATVKLLAVDLQGRALADVPVTLEARVRTRYTTRKRLVGGFYSYDSFDEVKALGTLCKGRTDAQGRLNCHVRLDHEGEIQLFARATDAQGRLSKAAQSVWVWGGEAWFDGGNDDRIDVIPDKTHYRPGETARITVRMPFRHAEALVAVEREGVLDTRVVALDGREPVVKLPIEAAWGPNVYVSVLAVRGRIRSIPWTSFFDWGWHHPADWFHAWRRQVSDAPEPAGRVDLAKPSFRFGVAQIRVNDEQDRLQVKVTTDHAKYQVRGKAQVTVRATLPDGKPAAHASVAFAAVDEALLDLKNNTSWDVLEAMRVERDYGVRTASSDGRVVGRRHYGRKAVPVGGGGGLSATRDLFDTLLLWRGDITLDDQGEAKLTVPLNDSLTRFRLVAVVVDGADKFGTGATDITVTQDVQVVSGLPRIIREGDHYRAAATVRNRMDHAAEFTVSARVSSKKAGAMALPEQTLTLKAGASRTVGWEVTAPLLSGATPTETLHWTFDAQVPGQPKARDRIAVTQRLEPRVPITVRQATLVQVQDGVPQQLPLGVPETALLNADGAPRGEVRVALQSSLAGTLPGVRDWLADYPFNCLEQLSSKAIGMRDLGAWQALMQRLPDFEADSGLVSYFPGGHGSVALTAQLLEVTARARALGWDFALPEDTRQHMIAALLDVVHGRLSVDSWAPADDRDWQKIIAVQALALSGGWRSDLLDGFDSTAIDHWPTPILVDWLTILQVAPDLADRDARLRRTRAILRARLSRHGASLVVSDATAGDGWWLMSNVETTQARLLMAAVQWPSWQDEVSRLMTGLLSLQSRGAWSTTTANVLGVLAVNHYAQKKERHAGEGAVQVALAPSFDKTLPWRTLPTSEGVHRQTLTLPWPKDRAGTLALTQQGEGSGWATVTARAAVPQTSAVDAGMRIERKVIPVEQAKPTQWSVGDIYRVQLKIHTQEPIVWSVVSDPVPAGASILGGGLGRDSRMATRGESRTGPSWDGPSFVERDAGVYRAYFEVMKAGTQTLEYTVRVSVPGTYDLPPTRAEALYQPAIFGSRPNAPMQVVAAP